MLFCHCEPLAARQSRKIFTTFLVSQSLKPLRPSFLNKQERGKELATLVVSSLRDTLVFLFCSGVAGLVVVYNNNFKQVLTLYPHKIKNTSATQMRGFKD
jgi:hypothetical protein